MNKDADSQPLSEATFLILLSLADGPLHGYAMLRAVEELSDGRVTISTGTLYGALKRFLDSTWIRRVSAAADQQNSRERQSYELTTTGRKVLRAEAQRLDALARAARTRLKVRES